MQQNEQVTQLPPATVTGNPFIKETIAEVKCMNADLIIVLTGANFTDSKPGEVGPQEKIVINVDELENNFTPGELTLLQKMIETGERSKL